MLNNIDLTQINLREARTTVGMFYGCSALTNINLNNETLKNLSNASYMFFGCTNITELDLQKINFSVVGNLTYMFGQCSKLERLYVNNTWGTGNAQKMNMFEACPIDQETGIIIL